MKNKIFNLIVVLLLIVSMICGCSKNANQTSVSTDNNKSSTVVNNNSNEQANTNQNALDSKLVELYLSIKGTQAYNEEHNIFGEYDAKFDSTGRLWIKKVEAGDTIRETHEMFINYTYTIYENINNSTYYTKKVGSDMNTNMVLKINYLKNGYDLTQEEYEKIQNEFESMEDYYNLLTNINKNDNKIIENGKEQNGRRINRELSKNNDEIINLFNDNGSGLDLKLIEIYNESKSNNKNDAKFDSDGLLWVKRIEDEKEIYQIYFTDLVYREYIYDLNSNVEKYYENSIDINKEYQGGARFEYISNEQKFENIRTKYEQIVDKFDEFISNKCIISDLPKIELVTSKAREKEIIDKINANDANFTREKKYITYYKLYNIFNSICFGDKSNWNYLELSNEFKNKYKDRDGIFSPFCVENNFFTFEALNNNIVKIECLYSGEKDSNIKRPILELPNDYRFYITFIYDDAGNVDDIVDVKCMLRTSLPDSGSSYVSGASKEGLQYICYGLAQMPPIFIPEQTPNESERAEYSNVYTSDELWKKFKQSQGSGLLGIDISNINTDEYGNWDISITNYNEQSKTANIIAKMKDGSEHNYFIKWRTKEYNLLDDIEIVDLNDVIEYQDGKFYLNGVLQNNTWVYNNGYWYYCDKDGNIVTNKWIDGKYLDLDGKKIVSGKTPDGKYVDGMGYVIDDLSYDLVSSAREKDILSDAWYKTRSGLWYYFENDRTTTKKGWFTDSRDNQTYYLEPETGIMQVGYVNIDGDIYYFNESTDNEPNWYEVGDGIYESYGKKVKAYGSMFRDEETPDGKRVDADGKLIK